MHRSVPVPLVTLLFVGCERWTLERKLIGKWTGCSMDTCSITTFSADHTFSNRFEDADSDSYSGTWRTEGKIIILHVERASTGVEDILGKDMRWIIFDFHGDTLIAGYDAQHQLPLTRVK